MRGSLGVWAEPLNGGSEAPLPILDLHINVWRDLPGGRSSVDFGFQLTEVDNLQRIFLYIPATLQITDVEDLSEVLKFGQTLSAVFNDTVEITGHRQGSFDVRRSNGFEFRIYNLEPIRDFDIEYVPISDRENGSVVKFSTEFCDRLRQAPGGAAYLRVRVHLSPANGEIFYSYASPADSWLLSRFYRTELNEFRLNERRSFPDAIVRWSMGSEFRIRRVLYFLIRDFRYELLVQHVQFKRTRRLEPDIWNDYLAPTGKRGATKRVNDVGERMLIYQWREDAPPRTLESAAAGERSWIEDFSAFASFKSPQDNIWAYVIAILALGALGGALQAVIFAVVVHFKWPSIPSTNIWQALVCFLILVVLLGLIVASKPMVRGVCEVASRIRLRFRNSG